MYKVTINWGEEGENIKTYSFKKPEEREAFRYGAHEAQGWNDYTVIDESEEDNSND